MIDGDGTVKVGEVVGWLVGAVVAVLAWAGKRQVARIDDHESRLSELDRGAVTRDDMTQMEARLTNAVATGMAHIAERVGDVKAATDKAHERIDSLTARAAEWHT